jgi:hypothetical protein
MVEAKGIRFTFWCKVTSHLTPFLPRGAGAMAMLKQQPRCYSSAPYHLSNSAISH